MGPYQKIAGVGLALATLTACGSDSFTSPESCTLIGSMPGVSVTLDAPYAAKVSTATLKVCWNGVCRTPEVKLDPSSDAVPAGKCEGTDRSDAACGASASPNGGKHGFARVEGLPKSPVRVDLELRDADGDRLLNQRLDVTPRASYPNGPDCDEGAPQTGLVVTNGRVTPRA